VYFLARSIYSGNNNMNKLGLGHELNISQTLEMMLSPRMIQMLRMLNLSYMELVEEINKASEENVMLELEKPDRLIEYLKQISTERIPKKAIIGEELPGVEAIADTTTSLEEHLLKQLELEDVEGMFKDIAEALIGSIDDRGYLMDHEAVSKRIIAELNVEQSDIDEMLELIQGFEPEGVGARDLKECLMIQVREMNFETPELEKVLLKAIDGHLEDLANKDFEKIAKALKIGKDGVERLAEFIKNNLNPNPGSQYCVKAPCVIPSFYIKKENDKYQAVNLEKTYGPVLKISPSYERMLNDPRTDKESIEFLKNKLSSAKDFLENIQKRQQTIEKIVDRIVDTQAGFFEGGPVELSPLMQKNIADELGLHPSTISRAISNKYLQTPRGVFRLKMLCPREVKGLTSEKIKNQIEEVIASEDKRSPLSDDEIAQKLKDKGVDIHRRTVAVYRKKLGMKIASKRVSAGGGSPP
jgi:RNA polymerase sigma-54 factor